MNQDAIKEALTMLKAPPTDFQVIFSGRRSKHKNGAFMPGSNEIILHNKNFEDESGLVLAALHEYAHFLDFSTRKKVDHFGPFKSILSGLIHDAREDGLLALDLEPLRDELDAIKKDLEALAETERKIGKRLSALKHECFASKKPFDVIVEHELRTTMKTANHLIAASQLELFAESDLSLTPDEQRLVIGQRNEGNRDDRGLKVGNALQAVADSSNIVSAAFQLSPAKPPRDPESPVEIKKEIKRLEKTVTKLLDQKTNLEERLLSMESPADPVVHKRPEPHVLNFSRREAVNHA